MVVVVRVIFITSVIIHRSAARATRSGREAAEITQMIDVSNRTWARSLYSRTVGSADPSDSELISRINAGDAAAFEMLYFRYRDWVVRLARRFTGNESDALDVLQDTFIYLYRKFPGFTLTARLTTFLWPAVRHLSLQARRKRAMSLAINLADLDLPAAQLAPTSGDTEDLPAMLASLSAEHRQVILMRFVDDLTTDEIAALLAIPAGTVKSRLHHAILQLRNNPSIRRYL